MSDDLGELCKFNKLVDELVKFHSKFDELLSCRVSLVKWIS